MRATAALKGYDPDKVVPKNKWVMGVKVSATPGLIEAKFPNPSQGKKAYRFDVIATYTQLKNLMGQAAFDRYLLGGESQRWDLPKRKENELEKGKEKELRAQSGTNENAGFRDDELPTSAEQIQPDEDAEEEDEEEEEDDETTKAAKQAGEMLRMETETQDD